MDDENGESIEKESQRDRETRMMLMERSTELVLETRRSVLKRTISCL